MSSYLSEIVEEVRRHPRLIVVDDYEITVQRIRQTGRDFSSGQVARERSDEKIWVGLRLLHRRQPGRTFTELSSLDALGALAETAYEAASRSSVDPWFRFPLWKPAAIPPPAPVSEALPELDSLFPKLNMIPLVFEENYACWDVETLICRKSEKRQLSHRRQVHSLKFALLNRAADDYFWLREERAAARRLDEREDWLEALLMQSVALSEGNRFDDSGRHFVLMAPAVAAALLRAIAGWFHADAVHSEQSPLARPDSIAFSAALSITDDGAHPDGALSAPFDMEGSLRQRTRLVTQGRLTDLLHDASTAARDNRISTGNYLRTSELVAPRIQASQIFFEPSAVRPADLIRAMSEGYILQSLDTLEPLPNESTSFRLVGSGWRVDGGSCVEPLRGISMEFDMMDLLRRAVEVGNDLTFFGSQGSPSILFENVPLGKESP